MLFVPTWHEHSVYIEQYLQKTSLVTTTLSHFFCYFRSLLTHVETLLEGRPSGDKRGECYIQKINKGLYLCHSEPIRGSNNSPEPRQKVKKIAKASRWGLQSAREGTASTHSTGRATWRAVWVGLNGFWSCLIWPCACYVCLYLYVWLLYW